jgi:hypothetical protein
VLLLLAGVGAAALALRLWGISGEDLWIDEIASRDSTRSPLAEAMRWAALADVHPPGYVLLLRIWTALLTDADLALRSLSVLAGLSTVLLLPLLLLRSGAGTVRALAAGSLLAVHAGHVHFSQEVRAYPLMGLWALLFVWAASALLRRPGIRRATVLAVAAGAGLWLHHVCWLVLFGAALGVGWLAGADRGRVRWLGIGLAGGAALATPWTPILLHQATGLPEGFSAHLRRPLDLEAFATVLGPWGGLQSAWAPPAGAVLWLSLLLAVARWREPGEARGPGASAPPLLRPLLLLGAAAAVAATVLPALIPATPLQEGLLARVMLPGCLLAAALPACVALAVECAGWLRQRFGGASAAADHSTVAVAMWTLAGAGLLSLAAVASGRMGIPRNLLPLVPLAAMATGAGLAWGPGIARKASVGCAVALVLLGSWSALGHSDRVQPRPAFRAALEAARAGGARSVAVNSPFDEPAVRHAAGLLGMPSGFVRAASSPVRLGAGEAMILTRSPGCSPDARPLQAVTDLQGRPIPLLRITRMRAVCLVETSPP